MNQFQLTVTLCDRSRIAPKETDLQVFLLQKAHIILIISNSEVREWSSQRLSDRAGIQIEVSFTIYTSQPPGVITLDSNKRSQETRVFMLGSLPRISLPHFTGKSYRGKARYRGNTSNKGKRNDRKAPPRNP